MVRLLDLVSNLAMARSRFVTLYQLSEIRTRLATIYFIFLDNPAI